MDQVNRFDNLDPIFSPPLVSPPLVSPPADASDALALPPLGTYPSKEALSTLFRAGQSREDTPLLLAGVLDERIGVKRSTTRVTLPSNSTANSGYP
jgi:hypothetical protein